MVNTKTRYWTKPTTEPEVAAVNLVSCLQHYKNAWIELVNNSELDNPIAVVNPELDDPFSWEFNYGAYESKSDIENLQFLNATEKDLTYNWTYAFGSEAAVNEYKKTRAVTEGLLLSAGRCCPVRIEDAQKYRDLFVKDGYQYRYPSRTVRTWIAHWKPAVKIWIPDPSIKKVFVVCFSTEPCDKEASLLRASQFFKDCIEIGS